MNKAGIYAKYFKRPMDIILSLMAIIGLAPVLLLVAVLVRKKLGKPVIFAQERPGLHEKIFKLYKFRSMTDERDEKGELLPDEVRLTSFGKFLRSTSLDELPELFNILKGDMSVVGPRPLLVKYLPLYNEFQKHRHDVRPGLSGLAQINGRNTLTWEQKFEYDVEYTKNITFLGDWKIILLTLKKVFFREGINAENSATMPAFIGTDNMESKQQNIITKNNMANSYLEKSRIYKNFHYSVIHRNELDYLHNKTLEMFKSIIKLFSQNDIRYMICGGTLLGAVTTGKFIPWDDDLDVCIFEEDYDRAIDVLLKGLPDDFVLQCSKSDRNYYLGWIKVRDRKSHVYPDCPAFKENGVWVDIYKLIKTNENNITYLIAKENIDYLDRRLKAGGLTKEEYNERLRKNNLLEKLEEAKKQSLSANSKTKYLIWSASKISVDEEWIAPLRKVNFENLSVTTFNNAEAYLKQHYGDNFNELPPDESRRIGINKIEC